MQGQGDYVYVGIIQSSTTGRPLFLHRSGGSKLSWETDSQPHFTTHISAPITSHQAGDFLWNMLAASGHLEANKTRLVPHAPVEADYPPVTVAPIKSLDRHVCVMLGEASRTAYLIIAAGLEHTRQG